MAFHKNVLFTLAATLILSGCATVPLASPQDDQNAKKISSPPSGTSGLYVYRNTILGQALRKDVTIDGKCIGKTANRTFFHINIKGNEEHYLSTESETGHRDMLLRTESGKNYFVEQVITLGIWSGGSRLKLVPTQKGEAEVQNLKLAIPGDCG